LTLKIVIHLHQSFLLVYVMFAIKSNNQISTLRDGCKQGIDQQIFNRKSISSKITHPQSWKLKAKLAGEKLKGYSNSKKKKKQTQDYNQNIVTQTQKW